MNLLVRRLGLTPYQDAYHAMQTFTATRTPTTPDECWLLQHPPTFTQGRNGHACHVLDIGTTPLIHIDRGGEVTYHGPGQLIVYLLIDIRRLGVGVRALVSAMEQATIALLQGFKLAPYARPDAPGVYIGQQKIASLGLRIKRGYSYHGLALNIDMDLKPFTHITPCGLTDVSVTDLAQLGVRQPFTAIMEQLLIHLSQQLGYRTTTPIDHGLTSLITPASATRSEPWAANTPN